MFFESCIIRKPLGLSKNINLTVSRKSWPTSGSKIDYNSSDDEFWRMVKRTFIDILATLNYHLSTLWRYFYLITNKIKILQDRLKKVRKLQIQKHNISFNVSETFGIEDLGIESKNLLHHEIIYQNWYSNCDLIIISSMTIIIFLFKFN
jgi:hypothetical protein